MTVKRMDNATGLERLVARLLRAFANVALVRL
jgi:hypothetical protein